MASGSMRGPGEPHDEGERLIFDAFSAARESGRSDWERMTIAVLKNRILTLTERTFDESHWGAETFREFVAKYTDVLTIDDRTRPATVVLSPKAAQDVASATPAPARTQTASEYRRRVRRDLWRAVLDYSSGDLYVWDGERAVGVDAETLSGEEDLPRLPTITADTLDEWRGEFVDSEAAAGAQATVTAALEVWKKDRLPDRTLPAPLRRHWNGELKRHVIERLTAWFESTGLPVPPDFVDIEQIREEAVGTTKLRELVVACVQGMTRAELEELRLPASALLRTRQ